MDVGTPSRTRQGMETAGEAASLRRLGGFRSLEDAVKLRLDGGPTAASKARRALSTLRSELDPPLLESLRLLVTELITNAVRHTAARKVELLVVVSQPAVRVEVMDPGPGFDPDQRRKRDHQGGWGLFLVDRLADRWGVIQEGDGTRVWFELERRI